MDISAYFNRIGYPGPSKPARITGAASSTGDARTTGAAAQLRDLQRAHLFAVPFENLDIHLGRPIQLDEDALFDKIVTRRRGGFCYELNGLFARLLESLGYQVTLLSATCPRPGNAASSIGAFTPEFDHLALEVRAPDDPQTAWLVDVGFGDGPLEPLRLDHPGEQAQERRTFQIRTDGDYEQLWERGADGEWAMLYRYTRQPHAYAEFSGMCRYHQTSPESSFTRKRLCTLFTPEGRATLSGLTLILTDPEGHRVERELEGEAAFRKELEERFGVVI